MIILFYLFFLVYILSLCFISLNSSRSIGILVYSNGSELVSKCAGVKLCPFLN